MPQDEVTVRTYTDGFAFDGSPGRYLPGANYEENVRALEKIGFIKAADAAVDGTGISVSLNGSVEQRYRLAEADLQGVVRTLRKAGFEIRGE